MINNLQKNCLLGMGGGVNIAFYFVFVLFCFFLFISPPVPSDNKVVHFHFVREPLSPYLHLAWRNCLSQ